MNAVRRSERACLLAGDAELVVDEELDGGVVDLADEDGAVEAADGDFGGVEGFLHGFGAFADEGEEAFALTFGGLDGEGDGGDAGVGLGGEFQLVDEFADGDGGGEGVVPGVVEFVEDADAGAELGGAAVAGAGENFSAAAGGEETERALVELEAGRFGDGGGEEVDGVADVVGLAGGVFFAAGNGDGGADVVGGLHEGDGGGALAFVGDDDDAGDCAAGVRGESEREGGEGGEGGGEEAAFHGEGGCC